jgi:hypothetical protein
VCLGVFSLYTSCRCFGPPTSEFVFARLARMVCKRDTRVYTGSGRRYLRPVRAARVLALVCSRDYKRSREGTDFQISGGEVCVCVSLESPSVSEEVGYTGERDKERKIRSEKRRSPGSCCSPSLHVDPVSPVDDDGVSLCRSLARRVKCAPTGQAAWASGVSGGASPCRGGRRMLQQDRRRRLPAGLPTRRPSWRTTCSSTRRAM